MADYKTEDCIHAIQDFRNDALKAHNVPYQWLAMGATALPDLGQPVFTPRRYVSRKLSLSALSTHDCEVLSLYAGSGRNYVHRCC